jgi:hypothetical protein
MRNMFGIILLSIVVGSLAFLFAWDRNRAFNDPTNEAMRTVEQVKAVRAGTPEPEYSQSWYEQHPVTFGFAAGAIVFAIGSMIVIAPLPSASSSTPHSPVSHPAPVGFPYGPRREA